MPDIVGRLRTPRLAAAPSSPAVGEVYYDTGTNILYWWNGTSWVSASGGGAGSADLVYNGSFPANTPYTDGDIVVSNGVAYMCVRPTSATPTPWAQSGAGDLVYNGAFPSNTPYTDGDIVLQNGIAYLCVRPTSAAPTPWPRANVITSYNTSLPTSPGDGQEAILVDSVINPTYQWHFRYNSNNASAYKWEFVGGASLRGFGGSLTLTTLMTTPTNLTGGPSLTVPRSGIYQCRYGAFHANNTTFVGAYTTMTQTYVGAVQVGTPLQTSHSATWQGASIAIITDLTLTANDVVNLKAWLDRTGNQSTVSNGWLELIPVRVS